MGLGAFHRAHQLWYTQHSEADPSDPQWGFASFTGRSPRMSDLLSAQDGLFTLMVRGPESDEPEIIGALSDPRAADDVRRLWELLAAPSTAVVTLTITEAACNLGPELSFDAAEETVAADLETLRAAFAAGSFDTDAVGVPASPAAKLVVGLAARRAAEAGPIAVVSCDNLSANDRAAHHAIQGLAAELDPQLGQWIERSVSFVGTSIDRITPATEDSLLDDVAQATGFADQAPVVTEPFSSWVLQGEFPAGRPEWERAGAVFVEDLEPFERRKLWLLNGAHSLPAYREALLERFENPRIRHNLTQIAGDGLTKLQMRAVPVLKAERSAGRSGEAAARMIAAWTVYVDGRDELSDSRAEQVLEASRSEDRIRARRAPGRAAGRADRGDRADHGSGEGPARPSPSRGSRAPHGNWPRPAQAPAAHRLRRRRLGQQPGLLAVDLLPGRVLAAGPGHRRADLRGHALRRRLQGHPHRVRHRSHEHPHGQVPTPHHGLLRAAGALGRPRVLAGRPARYERRADLGRRHLLPAGVGLLHPGQHPHSAITGINLAAGAAPAAFFLLAAILVQSYPLTDQRPAEILLDLRTRKDTGILPTAARQEMEAARGVAGASPAAAPSSADGADHAEHDGIPPSAPDGQGSGSR
nr:mannitol dehydrogenase family protein [Kocuria palustris]